MSDGERLPARDSAAAAVSAKASAISNAMANIPDDFGSYEEPAAAEPSSEPTSSEPSAAVSQEPTASTSAASEGQPSSQPVSTTLVAPEKWPKDRRDEFATLPENLKKILLERDKEYTQGIHKNAQENAEHRKRSEAIGQIFSTEHRQQMQSAGLDDVGAVRQLVSLHDFFTRDPAGYLKHLIQATGATPDQLFGGNPKQQAQPEPTAADASGWKDPDVVKLEQHIATLEAKLAKTETHLTQFQTTHHQREQMTLREEVDAFRSKTDDSGNPAYPHYEAVMPVMKHLIDSDPEIAAIPDWKAQQKLKAAYDKAVWLNPDVRTQLIDAQVNQGLSKQLEAAKVDKARDAATKKPAPGANGTAKKGKMSRAEAVAYGMKQAGL